MTIASDIPPRLADKPRARSTWIVIVLIFLFYARMFTADFTWWDDQVTIHHNGRLNPPTLETLRHYWTTPEMGLYVPVTSTTWAALSKLAYVGMPDDFGVKLNPLVFHTASVLLHLASSLIVLNILRRLIPDETAALAGALLFALHPVQVETIGWVSGMKDLLCWFFALSSLLLYLRRAQASVVDGRSAWHGFELPTALFLMTLAILSKPTAMVLPAAIAVIDVLLVRRPWRRTLVNLLPFFALTIAGAVLARDAQFVSHVKAAPLWQRPFIVGDSLAFYVRKIVWPDPMTIDYGRTPAAAMASPLGYLWWLLPTAIGFVALIAAKRGAFVPIAALLIAAIGVSPVSGIATFQMQSFSTVTDHYLYFSMLGLALLLAWALSTWQASSLRVLAFAAIAACGVRSFVQSAVWQDSFALFGHAASVNEHSYLSANNMAAIHLAKQPPDMEVAERYIDEAYALNPDDFYVLSNYAAVKARLGKRELAFPAWDKALELIKSRLRLEDFRASFCAEVIIELWNLNELDRAEWWMHEAIAANPNEPRAANAISLVRRGLAARAATRPATQAMTGPTSRAATQP